jgi:hypothetical protein
VKEKPTVGSPFFGVFLSDHIPKAKKDEMNLSEETFPHVAIPITHTGELHCTILANSKKFLKLPGISFTP